MLAQLVIGRLGESREGHTRGEERRRGPNCLLCSEAGRWYLYDAEPNERGSKYANNLVSRKGESEKECRMLSPATDPHGDES